MQHRNKESLRGMETIYILMVLALTEALRFSLAKET